MVYQEIEGREVGAGGQNDNARVEQEQQVGNLQLEKDKAKATWKTKNLWHTFFTCMPTFVRQLWLMHRYV